MLFTGIKQFSIQLHSREKLWNNAVLFNQATDERLKNPLTPNLFMKIKGTNKLVSKFPSKLCVHDPDVRVQFLTCLNYIKANLHYQNGLVIDLTKTTSMSTSGAVALFSQITSAQILSHKDDFFTFLLPEDQTFKNLIRYSGLWDAIKAGGKRKLDKLWDTQCRFQSGYDPDKHLELTFKMLESEITIPHRLKEAINEAVLNIVQHAYSATPGSVRRWWQYSALIKEKKSFVFVICDKGNSIPFSMNKMQAKDDADAIRQAMTYGISSTGKPWRGKGSSNLKKPVELDYNDQLIVLSRKGIYKYTSKDLPIESLTLEIPFHGTLIAWKCKYE
jgi:hypothetical protein